MHALHDTQQRVLDTLLHDTGDAAALLRPRRAGLSAAQRLSVYRNNLYEGLADALAAVYPVVQQLVGERFFRQAARRYIRQHPPSAGTLLGYGAALPRFLQRLEVLKGLPYLPAVATLEWSHHVASHAEELPPLELGALAALPPERLATLRLALQPGVRFVASRYPVLAIWQAHQSSADPAAAPISLDAGGVRLLVVPLAGEVEFRRLDAAEARWLRALAHRRTLTEALAAALEADPAFDLGAAIARHFARGLFCHGGEP